MVLDNDLVDDEILQGLAGGAASDDDLSEAKLDPDAEEVADEHEGIGDANASVAGDGGSDVGSELEYPRPKRSKSSTHKYIEQ